MEESNKAIKQYCKNCEGEYHRHDVFCLVQDALDKDQKHLLNEWNGQGFCSLWCMVDSMIEGEMANHRSKHHDYEKEWIDEQ